MSYGSGKEKPDIEKVLKNFEKEKRKRALKQGGAGRKAKSKKAPRQRDWEDLLEDEYADYDDFERIMPADETDRRRAVEDAVGNLADGRDSTAADLEPNGRVVEVGGGLIRVRMGDDTRLCTLRGTLTAADSGERSAVAVGDNVLVTQLDDGGGVIEAVAPRRSELARLGTDAALRKHVIAANVDQLLIVAAWRQPQFWPELVDRALIIAERAGLRPLLAVHKADLDIDVEERAATVQAYRAAGVEVFETSAVTGLGIPDMRAALAGQTTALVGLSGVGKSSLLTAVEPGFNLRAGEVNEDRGGHGRHTTTSSVLLPFAGGFVVDTPGVRELGMAGIEAREVAGFYPEFLRYAAGCQFGDCLHIEEPGCAVRDAVEMGAISPIRYESYQKLVRHF